MTEVNISNNNPKDVQHSEWRLLQVYLYYRLALALSLVLAYFVADQRHLVSEGSYNNLYFITVMVYGFITTISILLLSLAKSHLTLVTFSVIIIDILTIGLLEYSNGARNSNLTILLVVTVAAGGILVQGKLATFFAAVATLVVLYKQLINAAFNGSVQQQDFVQSAFIGIACFATSILAQLIANRLRESTELAGRQAKDLANLEALNHHIIQRMRTGIIVSNQHEHVILINDACWKLFGMPPLPQRSYLENVSPQLAEQYRQWLDSPYQRARPFRATLTGPEVQANFTLLETGDTANSLIFVEDNTRLAQQAQQLKLASLGGLTASIAHEIRNPLGAISHAAQLLLESPDLTKSDMRLSEIIHQHGNRMNKIIENILQLSRRKQSTPELLNLKLWVENFIAEYCSTQDEAAKIELSCEKEAIMFRVDPSQIHQVLTNLFSNGLRYSEKSSGQKTLKVIADVSPQTEQPILDIIDFGPGISKQQFDKIFEPFYTSEKSGTGLGLYIARELCEANQARLDLIPTNQGSCFRITFSHPARIVTI